MIAHGRLIAVDTPRLLGRRDAALATVSWRTPQGAWERMRSATPTALVAHLAARFGGEVPGLTVTRPTLEDVYLEMISDTTDDAAAMRSGSAGPERHAERGAAA